MDKIKFKVNIREAKGKEKVKKIRKEGIVPAVVYGGGVNTSLSIPLDSLKLLKSMHYSESVIIDMEISGGEKVDTISVLLKDIQFHPLTEKVIHVDFFKVSLKEKIKVHVPVALIGESKVVKEGEGVLDQVLRDVEIEALPLDIPEKIVVDISELTIGHSFHAGDLNIADNVKLITDPQATVVTVVAKKEEVEEVPEVEEGVETTEPEVIKEKKEESEEPSKEEKSK